ncbi:hypothetical protein RJ55_03728 [Drechmeria coniospora]|nr:hypothetical protein RJ55_03728 [Drechmeria coniospora]
MSAAPTPPSDRADSRASASTRYHHLQSSVALIGRSARGGLAFPRDSPNGAIWLDGGPSLGAPPCPRRPTENSATEGSCPVAQLSSRPSCPVAQPGRHPPAATDGEPSADEYGACLPFLSWAPGGSLLMVLGRT